MLQYCIKNESSESIQANSYDLLHNFLSEIDNTHFYNTNFSKYWEFCGNVQIKIRILLLEGEIWFSFQNSNFWKKASSWEIQEFSINESTSLKNSVEMHSPNNRLRDYILVKTKKLLVFIRVILGVIKESCNEWNSSDQKKSIL